MYRSYLVVGIFSLTMLLVTGTALAQGSSAPGDEPVTAEPEPTDESVKEPVTPPVLIKKEEIKVKMANLPEPVQMAVKKQTKGIKAYSLFKKTTGMETTFEVKMKVKGLAKEIEIDTDGNVVKVEQEVKWASVPAKVKKGLTASAGKGKIVKVKSIAKGGSVTYEATIKTGKETSTVFVGADGMAVQQ